MILAAKVPSAGFGPTCRGERGERVDVSWIGDDLAHQPGTFVNRARTPLPPSLTGMMAVLVTATVIAMLYFAREVFIPITLAVLLSFLLAPAVRWLRR
jgi:hypothetical protein